MKVLLCCPVILLAVSCATRHPPAAFRVIPADPSYLLRSPDNKATAFPDVPNTYTGVGHGWVDLRPQMGLRIENAYYREGAPKRGIQGFLGTEVARYSVRPGGTLRLVSVEYGVAQRPNDQPAVQELLRASQRRYHYHRFFYQVWFRSKGETRGAVFLGAGSKDEIGALGARLLNDPDAVCRAKPGPCTVFPEACTVSVEMQIVLNGAPHSALWGSLLANIMVHPRRIELLRPYAGRLMPINIDPDDPNALRLPILPGDHITWDSVDHADGSSRSEIYHGARSKQAPSN